MYDQAKKRKRRTDWALPYPRQKKKSDTKDAGRMQSHPALNILPSLFATLTRSPAGRDTPIRIRILTLRPPLHLQAGAADPLQHLVSGIVIVAAIIIVAGEVLALTDSLLDVADGQVPIRQFGGGEIEVAVLDALDRQLGLVLEEEAVFFLGFDGLPHDILQIESEFGEVVGVVLAGGRTVLVCAPGVPFVVVEGGPDDAAFADGEAFVPGPASDDVGNAIDADRFLGVDIACFSVVVDFVGQLDDEDPVHEPEGVDGDCGNGGVDVRIDDVDGGGLDETSVVQDLGQTGVELGNILVIFVAQGIFVDYLHAVGQLIEGAADGIFNCLPLF